MSDISIDLEGVLWAFSAVCTIAFGGASFIGAGLGAQAQAERRKIGFRSTSWWAHLLGAGMCAVTGGICLMLAEAGLDMTTRTAMDNVYVVPPK